jgi:arylsulfatase A-like enzyme
MNRYSLHQITRAGPGLRSPVSRVSSSPSYVKNDRELDMKMKLLITALTPLLSLGVSVSVAAEKPNIIFVITDDQSWDSLGFMGGNVHTPRLDQMAKDGLFLSNFNVSSTVCSPSRYSFLTGRYAGRCEGEKFLREHPPGDQTQVENIGELELHRWNLAMVLQQNGYRTGFVGKAHVIRHDWLHTNRDAKTSNLIGWPQDADPRDPNINRLMKVNHQRWCDEIKKYGFDYADGIYAANLKELKCDALNVHNLDWTIDKAVQFLDTSSDDPFFLYVSTTLHHGPAPWNNAHSLDSDPRMTGEGFVEAGFDVLPSRQDVLKRNRQAGFQDRDAYALWLDDGVGAIIDKVHQLGIEKETLVVFVSDHGSYRHGKTTLHEYGMRVPMLCLWPGTIKAGSTYDGIVANIDFAPTVLDVCGIERPEDYPVDGLNFNAVLQGSQKPLRNVLFGEMGHSRGVKTEAWKYIAVRYPEDVQKKIDQGHKFKAFQNQPPLDRPYLTRNGHLGHFASKANPHYFEADQLYDLKTDPEENHNVFEQYPEVAARMKRELSKALLQFENRPFGEFTSSASEQN